MSAICPLSKSLEVELIEKISVKDIVKLYYKSFNFDISLEFKNLQEIKLYYSHESDLIFFNPSVTGSEFFYEKLQNFEWYYMEQKNEYDYASQLIKESDIVLEIGSGKGAFAKKIPSKNYVGLELSQSAIEMALENSVYVISESIQSHAINNTAKYDVVCAFQVLEHIADIRSFIESSILCLKPGGILIYSVPSVDSFAKYVSNYELDMPPHHVTRWSDLSLKNIAKYFPVEHIEIWHEPLQFIHKEFYAITIFKKALLQSLRRRIKNIDKSLTTKAIGGISRILGKIFAQGLTDIALMPRGMSVTSVYRKK